MSEFLIRQYKPSDKEEVFRLHIETMKAAGAYAETGNWDEDFDDIEGIYINNGGDFVVGILDGVIVASGALKKITEKVVELKRMRVSIPLQHHGYGRKILSYLEARAKILGYETIELDTLEKQTEARRFYENNGYKEFKREDRKEVGETIFYKKEI